MKRALLTIATSCAVACGGQPRPAELISLELRRSVPAAEQLRVDYPDLTETSDADYARARSAWRRKHELDARYYARLASISWRTAEARQAKSLATRRVIAAKNVLIFEQGAARAAVERRRALDATVRRSERAETRRRRETDLRRIRRGIPRRHLDVYEAVNAVSTALSDAENDDVGEFALDPLLAAEKSWGQAILALRERRYGDAVAYADTAQKRIGVARAEAQPAIDRVADYRARAALLYTLRRTISDLPGADPQFAGTDLVVALRNTFSRASGKIREEARETLEAIGKIAADQVQIKLRVEGHTAGGEPDVVLRSRSRAQAEAIASRLVASGVPRDQIEVTGRSATVPIDIDETVAGRAANERVEIIFVGVPDPDTEPTPDTVPKTEP